MANKSMADGCGATSMSSPPTSMGKKGGGASMSFGKKASSGAGKLGKSSKLAESIARLKSKGALA